MEHLLIEVALRSTLIAVGTALVLALLRVKTAAARHAGWTAVLGLMMLLPVWIAWGPKGAARAACADGGCAEGASHDDGRSAGGSCRAVATNASSKNRAVA